MPFNLTAPVPEKGVAVPIRATFTGHTIMPFWWAWASNNLNPKLRLFEDELELKVIRKSHRRKLKDITVADAYCFDVLSGKIKTNNLILTWNDTPWTFTASIPKPEYLMQTLEFLQRKNIALSPRATRLLSESKL